jgi:hypothetical protein
MLEVPQLNVFKVSSQLFKLNIFILHNCGFAWQVVQYFDASRVCTLQKTSNLLYGPLTELGFVTTIILQFFYCRMNIVLFHDDLRVRRAHCNMPIDSML